MKYIGLILTLALFSCSKDGSVVSEEVPINYSFFIAGHTYGTPGVDNEGVHPPFRNKFDFIKDDESLNFGVFTGDIVPVGTIQNWDEIDQNIFRVESIDNNLDLSLFNFQLLDECPNTEKLFQFNYPNAFILDLRD